MGSHSSGGSSPPNDVDKPLDDHDLRIRSLPARSEYGATRSRGHVSGEQSKELLQHLQEFPALLAASEGLALKLHFQPSHLSRGLNWLMSLQSGLLWQAHTGTGIVYALLAKQPASLGQWLLQMAHPEVQRLGGRLQLWRVPETADMTTTALWGPAAW